MEKQDRLSLEEMLKLAQKVKEWSPHSIGRIDFYQGNIEDGLRVDLQRSWINISYNGVEIASNGDTLGTPLPEEDCKKIANLYEQAEKNYRERISQIKEDGIKKIRGLI